MVLAIGEPANLQTNQLRTGSIFVIPPTIPTNSEEQDIEIPDGSQLEVRSIYPNPTSGDVKFEIYLPNAGEVRLSLFDLIGRERIILLDTYKAPGVYSVTWNGKDSSAASMPSGTYLVNLKSANQTESRMVTLVR